MCFRAQIQILMCFRTQTQTLPSIAHSLPSTLPSTTTTTNSFRAQRHQHRFRARFGALQLLPSTATTNASEQHQQQTLPSNTTTTTRFRVTTLSHFRAITKVNCLRAPPTHHSFRAATMNPFSALLQKQTASVLLKQAAYSKTARPQLNKPQTNKQTNKISKHS